MRIRLESRAAKLLAALVTLGLLVPYCAIAGSRYLAARSAQQNDRASLERAISLQSNDADYRERLGRYLLFSDQDAPAALRQFKLAASMNPYSASSWMGIAQAEFILGDEANCLQAIGHALEADPNTPSVAWDATSLFVATGHKDDALKELRFILANDPSSVLQGLQLLRHLEPSGAKAAREVLPRDPLVHFLYINLLVQSGHLDEAKQVWPITLGFKQPIDPQYTFYFLNSLLQAGDLEMAVRFWNELGKISREIGRLQQPGNLVQNPSFEYDTLNGGFDWLYLPSPDVDLRAETSDAHEGRRSLLVSFMGQPTTDIGMHQFVVLEPNTRYRFRGYMKSDLQTAHGVRFMLVDLTNKDHLFESEESIDDREWREFNETFVTRSNTGLTLLLVGRTNNSLVRGNVLIDDLRIEKADQ